MARKAGRIFFFVALCVSTPALAAGTWDCTFSSPNIANGTTGHATVEVDGDVLTEKTDAWKMSDERLQFPAMTVRFHVLENNEVGLVAAYPQAVRSVEAGPLIGATVLTLSKSDGDFRTGSVMTKGASDFNIGHCTLK
jgi:hypothetical protein